MPFFRSCCNTGTLTGKTLLLQLRESVVGEAEGLEAREGEGEVARQEGDKVVCQREGFQGRHLTQCREVHVLQQVVIWWWWW